MGLVDLEERPEVACFLSHRLWRHQEPEPSPQTAQPPEGLLNGPLSLVSDPVHNI